MKKFNFKYPKLSKFDNVNTTYAWMTEAAHTDPKSWGYVEIQLNANTIETFLAYSADDHGGQAYAYDKVKKLKNIRRALHGLIENEEFHVVEQYNPKTKRWEEV